MKYPTFDLDLDQGNIDLKKVAFDLDLCGSPPGVMMADTLSFNAKIGVVDF